MLDGPYALQTWNHKHNTNQRSRMANLECLGELVGNSLGKKDYLIGYEFPHAFIKQCVKQLFNGQYE